MSIMSTFLKAGALACLATAGATAANAETATVYVYEKGYFPNVTYLDGATQIQFINKTSLKLGLDYKNGGIMVNSLSAGSNVTVSASALSNNPLKEPYVYTRRDYYDGSGYETESGAAPSF